MKLTHGFTVAKLLNENAVNKVQDNLNGKSDYKLSFTSGALLFSESTLAVESFLHYRSWDTVSKVLLEENHLQTRMSSSAVRIIRETINRLKVLTDEQLLFFLNGSYAEKKNTLWVAICKYYRLIAEFSIEVIREKYLKMDYTLKTDDYAVFFNNKSEWHPELDSLSVSTRKKMQQILFRMLREAEIINSNNMILCSILTPAFIDLMKNDSLTTLAIFPVPEQLL